MKQYFSLIARLFFFNIILCILGSYSYSVLLGTKEIALTFNSIFGPMIGLYAGLPFTFMLYGLRFIFKGFSAGSIIYFFNPLNLKLPTLCAAAYWAHNTIFFRFIVPFLCIILFNIHPIGHQAFYYSFYWFIPLMLYFAPQKNIVVQALASSFIAHAVGSVVWLYVLPMKAETFLLLMPIVIIERLIIASGMVVVDTIVSLLRRMTKSISWMSRFLTA